MFCKNCGVYLAEGAVFCPECGTKQDKEGVVIDVSPSEITDVNDSQEIPDEKNEAGQEKEEYKEEEANKEPEEKQVENRQTEIVNSMISTDRIKYCHNCGAANAEKDCFCYNCGAAFETDNQGENTTQQPEKGKKQFRWKKGYTFVCLGVIVLFGIAVVLTQFVIPNINKPSTLIYVKDNEFNLFQKKDSSVLGDDVFEDRDDAKTLNPLYYYDNTVQVSENGKYIFYPQDYDDVDYGSEYSLYRRKLNDENDEELKIDSNVIQYSVLNDNKIIYIKDSVDRKLYISDLDDKEKIASDVQWFTMSADKKKVFWYIRNEDDEVSLYMQSVDGKGEKSKILSGVDYLCDYTDDFKIIVYSKDDSIYLMKNYEDKEKIDSDCIDVYCSLSSNGKGLYYTVEGDQKIGIEDFIEDKYVETDQQMQAPNITDYQTTTVKDSFWGPITSTVTDDEGYQRALEKYNEKQTRDYIRGELGTEENGSTLYYYDIESGERTQIQDGLLEGAYEMLLMADGVFVYDWINFEKTEKISMDKLMECYNDGEETLDQQLYDFIVSGKEVYLCKGTQQTRLPVDMEEYGVDITACAENPAENKIYMVINDMEGKNSVLLDFAYTAEEIEQHVMKDDVENIQINYICANGIYYICDYEGLGGTLYFNDEKVTDDVYNVIPAYGNKVMIEKDMEDSERTICLTEGAESEKIASEVVDWECNEEGKIAFLTDYNFTKYRGDLKLYNAGKVEMIDSDVSAIIGFY